jgi:hypothetical protein
MSEVTEVVNVMSAIKTFYQNHSNYVAGTGVLPSYNTLIPSMDCPDLITYCVTQAIKGSRFEIGIAQEVVFTSQATLREIDMISDSKSNIYTSYSGECSREVLFFNQSESFYVGVLNGSPTWGSQC